MQKSRRIFLLALAYMGGAGGLMVISLAATPSPSAVASAPATQKGGFAGAFKAMAYYDDSCRRCHGPQGSFYGPELGKNLTDKQLIDVIDRMAKGPGNAPLEEGELAAETAYHRALMAGNPFLSVTAVGAGKISGEVMPESKVTVSIGGKTIPAKVDDQSWTAEIPVDAKPADITVTAELNGKKTNLPLAKPPAYSNSTPDAATKPAK